MPVDQNLISIFEYALNQEETGKRFFQASLERMGYGAAVSAFKRVIEEEEHHILFINNVLSGLKQGGPDQIQFEKEIALPRSNFLMSVPKRNSRSRCSLNPWSRMLRSSAWPG